MALSAVLHYFPTEISEKLKNIPKEYGVLREIHMRACAPVSVLCDALYLLDAAPPTADAIQRTAQRMCQNSVYARQEELRQGFVTLSGGHRVGFCGKVVTENGTIRCLSEISSLHLRIAHAVVGAADNVLPHLFIGDTLLNTVIVSPPGCGKTTLLRDIARKLASEDYGFTVGIADERGEIAAMHRGTPQNDVGIFSDVYDGCPKALAMGMLLRGMAPHVVITDEIGGERDCAALEMLAHSGVRILCSAHGASREDLLARSDIGRLLRSGVLKKTVVLSGKGKVEAVI